MGFGVWVVDRPGNPHVEREVFPTHMAAAERVAELLSKNSHSLAVAWQIPDHVGPWVEPLGVVA